MIVRVYKVGDNLACILPKAMADKLKLHGGEEVDFYEIKPGMFTLVKKDAVESMLKDRIGDVELPAENKGFGIEEMGLLKKLDGIKFSDRIPYNVHKKLSSREREILSKLISKGAVAAYKGGKYSKTGVYSIKNEVYDLLKSGKADEKELSIEGKLERDGYLIIEDTREAESVCSKFDKEIRAGSIIGTRGFDKRFYVATRSLFVTLFDKIRQSMKRGASNAEDISKELKLNDAVVLVVLEIMKDKGDAIEKRRGTYELV